MSSFIDYALDGYKVNAMRYILKQPRGLKVAISECIGAVYEDMGRQEEGILLSCRERKIRVTKETLIPFAQVKKCLFSV